MKKNAYDMCRVVAPLIVKHFKAAMHACHEEVFREKMEAIRKLSPFFM